MCTIYLQGMGDKPHLPIKSFKEEKPRYKKPLTCPRPPSFSLTNHWPPPILRSPRAAHTHKDHTICAMTTACILKTHTVAQSDLLDCSIHRWWCCVIIFLFYMHTVSPVNSRYLFDQISKHHTHTENPSVSTSLLTVVTTIGRSYWFPLCPLVMQMNDFVIACVFSYLILFLLDLYYFIIVLYLNDSTLQRNTVRVGMLMRRTQGGQLTWITQYMRTV